LECLFEKKDPRVQWNNLGEFFGYQIACALAFLHSKKIIYKHLSPKSIFIDHKKAKLSIFGLTSTTPPPRKYSLPDENNSVKSDIFSFGVILQEMTTSVIPDPLRTLISKCTSTDPNDRPTCDELLNKIWTPDKFYVI